MKKSIKKLLKRKIKLSSVVSTELEKARKNRRRTRDLEKNDVELTAQIKLLRHILSK